MNVHVAPLEETRMKRKTNFDRYLEEHLKDPDFAEHFKRAEEAWDEVIRQCEARKAKGSAKSEAQECEN